MNKLLNSELILVNKLFVNCLKVKQIFIQLSF